MLLAPSPARLRRCEGCGSVRFVWRQTGSIQVMVRNLRPHGRLNGERASAVSSPAILYNMRGESITPSGFGGDLMTRSIAGDCERDSCAEDSNFPTVGDMYRTA